MTLLELAQQQATNESLMSRSDKALVVYGILLSAITVSKYGDDEDEREIEKIYRKLIAKEAA